MAIMVPREKWTDERLDDLNKKVDDGFADAKVEMREGFGRMDSEITDLRRDMDARFNSIDARFDALNRNLFWGLVTVVAALIGGNVF